MDDVVLRLQRVIDELKAGFVVCEACGEQEDTPTLDCVPDLESIAAVLAAQSEEAEGVGGARLMKTLAELARRAPLRTLHTICETQHQVSTVKLERYLGSIGDTLADYAFTLRVDFDKLSTALSAVTAERDNYKSWYGDAMDASNIAGFADMSAAQVIDYQDKEIMQLRAEVERLRPVAREFAGFFSSDEPRHWELHALADGAAMAAKEA